MIGKILKTSMLFTALFGASYSLVNNKQITVKGEGSSYGQAVADGLEKAMSQLKGVDKNVSQQQFESLLAQKDAKSLEQPAPASSLADSLSKTTDGHISNI